MNHNRLQRRCASEDKKKLFNKNNNQTALQRPLRKRHTFHTHTRSQACKQPLRMSSNVSHYSNPFEKHVYASTSCRLPFRDSFPSHSVSLLCSFQRASLLRRSFASRLCVWVWCRRQRTAAPLNTTKRKQSQAHELGRSMFGISICLLATQRYRRARTTCWIQFISIFFVLYFSVHSVSSSSSRAVSGWGDSKSFDLCVFGFF